MLLIYFNILCGLGELGNIAYAECNVHTRLQTTYLLPTSTY